MLEAFGDAHVRTWRLGTRHFRLFSDRVSFAAENRVEVLRRPWSAPSPRAICVVTHTSAPDSISAWSGSWLYGSEHYPR